jgi:NAD(P)H dehydrogenase (quinone)
MKTNTEGIGPYAVLGITGNVGGATARALLAAGRRVRAVVRSRAKAGAWSERGVELVDADMLDSTALAAAFAGVEGVFVMIPANFAPSLGFPETRAIVAALRSALAKARPPKVAYLSSIGAHRESGLGLITQLHILEQEMRTLPIPGAFIRPAWFLENFQWDVAPARDRGEIDAFLSPPGRSIPMVATSDIGELAARTL